ERPGHRLNDAACRERTLGLASAQLHRRKDRLARLVAALERRRRHAVDPDDADDLLDDVGLAVPVRAPRRRRDLHLLALARDPKAQPLQYAAELRERNLDAGEAPELAEREIDDQLRHLRVTHDGDLRSRAAAQFEHELRCQLQAWYEESRIDAALESITR